MELLIYAVYLSFLKAGIPLWMAQKIVQYRKRNKCFVHMNELLRIRGMSVEMFTDICKNVGVKAKADEITKTLNK